MMAMMKSDLGFIARVMNMAIIWIFRAFLLHTLFTGPKENCGKQLDFSQQMKSILTDEASLALAWLTWSDETRQI